MEDTKYKNLWGAVLKQAVKDLDSGNSEAIIDEVKNWFKSDSKHIGSFLWICELLGYDPNYFNNLRGTHDWQHEPGLQSASIALETPASNTIKKFGRPRSVGRT